MLQKNAITEVPPDSPGFYSNVFLVGKSSGGWRPVIDLKNLNAHIHAPHFRMFTRSSVLSSVEKGDYAFRIDLQDAYFHVPIHPSSRKYLRFAFKNRVYQFQVLTVRFEHGPSSFYSIGAHGDRLSAPSGDLSGTISRRLVDSPPRPSSFVATSGQLINTLDLVGFILNRKKSELDLQFLGIRLRLDLGKALLPESKAWEIPQGTKLYSSVPAYLVT